MKELKHWMMQDVQIALNVLIVSNALTATDVFIVTVLMHFLTANAAYVALIVQTAKIVKTAKILQNVQDV